MRRRTLIGLAAGAALLWPLEGRAQKSPPIIGFLNSASPEAYTPMLAAFREVLRQKGYEEGRDLLIEYRWAEGHYDRLPDMAAELVAGKVAVIVASGSAAPALAAKAATTDIPVVFISGSDPVRTGLVASLNRPGGNLTGISITFTNLVPKRLELLYLLAPEPSRLGALVNPNYPEVDFQKRELDEAAVAVHKPIEIVSAGTPTEIDTAFAGLATRGIGALLVGNDPFFVTRGEQFAALAAREKIPAIYSDRSYVRSGGLMSYGPNLAGAFRDAAQYVVRILNGAKPADLPVEQPTKFELVINLKAAKALGLTVPQSLLARADEVIE
jgi:putative tryptophan/tyrosine transport system substrate-binding protein